MEEVSALIAGKNYLTALWVSSRVVEGIRTDCENAQACVEKLEGICRAGFWNVPDNIVRHEGTLGGGETWRIAYKNSSLFRIVGFFVDDRRQEFIAIDAFMKATSDGYAAAQIKRMKEISEIKRSENWKKK